jgi:hypothetical protein
MVLMSFRKYLLIFTLLAIPLLAGSQCAFFFSSGGSSDSDDDDRSGLVVAVSSGTLVDAPVEGVNYVSGSLAGVTDSEGEFQYEVGNAICFYIGDIALGCAVQGKSIITPVDLVENGTTETPAVINIARLLQSLDANQAEEIISIPEAVRLAAIHSNEGVSSAIEFLDYADDPAFANAASQLVAVLTRDYPLTAVLVDAERAREHMIKSLARLQEEGKGY